MPKRKKRSVLPFLFILPAIAGALVLLFYVANYFLGIQSDSYQLYGPAEPSLSFYEKFNLSLRLVRDRNDLLELNSVEGEYIFEVVSGESPYQIAENLNKNQLIPNSSALIDYLVYKGYDTKLLTGTFVISAPKTPIEIALTLIDPSAIILEVFILPGWRVEEIADHLDISGIIKFNKETFLSLTAELPIDSPLPPNLPYSASVEGFLFPGTYIIHRDISEAELLTLFMQKFADSIDEELLSAIENQNLSLFEAVILASIIEREAVLDEEKTMISSVFFNRLNAGWKLETDPTVQYAVSSAENWWKNPLTWDDLAFDSLYNTYLYYGLPPGPISSPALSSIEAVAYPAKSPYFFFRAKCDGSNTHTFSITFEEHLLAECD